MAAWAYIRAPENTKGREFLDAPQTFAFNRTVVSEVIAPAHGSLARPSPEAGICRAEIPQLATERRGRSQLKRSSRRPHNYPTFGIGNRLQSKANGFVACRDPTHAEGASRYTGEGDVNHHRRSYDWP